MPNLVVNCLGVTLQLLVLELIMVGNLICVSYVYGISTKPIRPFLKMAIFFLPALGHVSVVIKKGFYYRTINYQHSIQK